MKKTVEEKKKMINDYMDYSEPLVHLLYDLIRLGQSPGFREVLKFSGIEGAVDSAYPSDYARDIRELYPDFDKGMNCFDYSENKFGEMRNIKNPFFDKIMGELNKL